MIIYQIIKKEEHGTTQAENVFLSTVSDQQPPLLTEHLAGPSAAKICSESGNMKETLN